MIFKSLNSFAVATLALGLAATPAWAHIGEPGEHLVIGYYFGHDETYEAPADPLLDKPKLLVDTHPWELGEVFWETAYTTGTLLGNGWLSETPGFDPLAIDDQEFDGHGFYSWFALGSPGAPNVHLNLLDVTAGLQIIGPGATLIIVDTPIALGDDFHFHVDYFISDADQSLLPGSVYTATYYLTDTNGIYSDSDPFIVQIVVDQIPEPGSALLLIGGVAGLLLRRR